MPGDECSVDIMMLAQDQSNQNFKNVLVLVDTNSNYIFARPLRGKSSQEVIKNLMEMLWENSYIPRRMNGDKGKEFVNKDMQKALSEYGIDYQEIGPDYKNCNTSERSKRGIGSL